MAAILGSKHATSKIAFLGAAVVFAACPLLARRDPARGGLGLVATIMLVVPLATLAYQSKLYLSPWLPHSAQHRIVIWGYTSNQIAKAPILGSGINTARALNDPDGLRCPVGTGLGFPADDQPAQPQRLPADLVRGRCRRGADLCLRIGLLVLEHVGAGAPEFSPISTPLS